MKKKISFGLAVCLALSSLSLTGCKDGAFGNYDNVLRVASWDEYIDMGGEDSYDPESKAMYDEFEDWYFEQTGKHITVEYVALQDNETMYNKIKMGDDYDLLCPSEYMAMKLKSENRLRAFPESFFDTSIETNYYAKNVSQYTKSIFEKTGLSEYIAGYMWGSTGFVFNPDEIDREIMNSWSCLTSSECKRKITAKDNVRDSYFMGLGLYYEDYLLSLDPTAPDYADILSEKMNDTSQKTMDAVQSCLEKARGNLYGLETDEGKTDVIMGRLDAAYQWSGDAVFIIDEAETEAGLSLEYSIPQSASNLWFDGFVMMDTIKDSKVDAALAFINFLSRPDNVVRNMYYIGYTSCIAGAEVYDYVAETYSAEDGETDVVPYDLSYFFGDEFDPLIVPEEQTRRQLFAQYPDEESKNRLVVMNQFSKDENERATRMWNRIK